jgi:hypothetical protein
VWMQLFHLLMADVLWIAVLLLVFEVTIVRVRRDVPISAGYRSGAARA